jgi:hypothetical protein
MEGTTMAPDARIVQTAFGFEVHPRVVFKRARETFTLLNNTGSDVRVSFPEALPVEPPEATLEPRATRTFNILDARPGVYDYRVELTVTDTRSNQLTFRASGGSDPEIIIDT